MAYTKTNWVNGKLPAINAGNLNKIEQGIYEAHEKANTNETNIGNLNDLQTTDKTNLVGAINSVVESGSNENGNWIKYADGTMICTKKIQLTTAMTSSWGALYESGELSLGQFPMPFISTPILSMTNNGTIGRGAMIEATWGTTETEAGQCWLCRGTSSASSNYFFSIIAIGKWK